MKIFAIILVIFGIILGMCYFHDSAIPRNRRFWLAIGSVALAGDVIIIMATNSLIVLTICSIIGVFIALYIMRESWRGLRADYKKFSAEYFSPNFELVKHTIAILAFSKNGRLKIDDDLKPYLRKIVADADPNVRKSARVVVHGLVVSKHIRDKDVERMRIYWLPSIEKYIHEHMMNK